MNYYYTKNYLYQKIQLKFYGQIPAMKSLEFPVITTPKKYTAPRTTSCTTPGTPNSNPQGTTLGVKWLSKKRSV